MVFFMLNLLAFYTHQILEFTEVLFINYAGRILALVRSSGIKFE